MEPLAKAVGRARGGARESKEACKSRSQSYYYYKSLYHGFFNLISDGVNMQIPESKIDQQRQLEQVAKVNAERYWDKIQRQDEVAKLKCKWLILCGGLCMILARGFETLNKYYLGNRDKRDNKFKELFKVELRFFKEVAPSAVIQFIRVKREIDPRIALEELAESIDPENAKRKREKGKRAIANKDSWDRYKKLILYSSNYNSINSASLNNSINSNHLLEKLIQLLDSIVQVAGIIENKNNSPTTRSIYTDYSDTISHIGGDKKRWAEVLVNTFDFFTTFFLLKLLIVLIVNGENVQKNNAVKSLICQTYVYANILNRFFGNLKLKHLNDCCNILINADEFKTYISDVDVNSYITIILSDSFIKGRLYELCFEYEKSNEQVIPIALANIRNEALNILYHKSIIALIAFCWILLSVTVGVIRMFLNAAMTTKLMIDIKLRKVQLNELSLDQRITQEAAPYDIKVFYTNKVYYFNAYTSKTSKKHKKIIEIVLTGAHVNELSEEQLGTLISKIICIEKILNKRSISLLVESTLLILAALIFGGLISQKSFNLTNYLNKWPYLPVFLACSIILLVMYAYIEILSDIEVAKKVGIDVLISTYERLMRSKIGWLDIFYVAHLIRVKALQLLFKLHYQRINANHVLISD
ncbi:MAG: hypothetical protein QW410_02355 [Nitrososphaerota archaeon]